MGVVMALANLKQIQDKSTALTEKIEKAICWGMIIFGCLMLAITFSRSAFVVVAMMFYVPIGNTYGSIDGYWHSLL